MTVMPEPRATTQEEWNLLGDESSLRREPCEKFDVSSVERFPAVDIRPHLLDRPASSVPGERFGTGFLQH